MQGSALLEIAHRVIFTWATFSSRPNSWRSFMKMLAARIGPTVCELLGPTIVYFTTSISFALFPFFLPTGMRREGRTHLRYWRDRKWRWQRVLDVIYLLAGLLVFHVWCRHEVHPAAKKSAGFALVQTVTGRSVERRTGDIFLYIFHERWEMDSR